MHKLRLQQSISYIVPLVVLVVSCSDGVFTGTSGTKKQKDHPKNTDGTTDNCGGCGDAADPAKIGDGADQGDNTDGNGSSSDSKSANGSLGSDASKSNITPGDEGDCTTRKNLIENSDFEKGNADFTSKFTFDGTCRGKYSPGLASQYSVNSTPNVCHSFYTTSPDDKGQMLIVNIPAAGQAEKRFWCQTVHVNAGKHYKLSARLRAAVPSVVDSQPTSVAFTINGTEVMATFKLEKDWQEHKSVSIPKTAGDIEFCGESRTQNIESTDLIADDFTFGECK